MYDIRRSTLAKRKGRAEALKSPRLLLVAEDEHDLAGPVAGDGLDHVGVSAELDQKWGLAERASLVSHGV